MTTAVLTPCYPFERDGHSELDRLRSTVTSGGGSSQARRSLTSTTSSMEPSDFMTHQYNHGHVQTSHEHLSRQHQRAQQRRHSHQHHLSTHGTGDYRIPALPQHTGLELSGPLNAVPSSPIFDPHIPNLHRIDTTGALSLVNDGPYVNHANPGSVFGRDGTSPLAQIQLHPQHHHHQHSSVIGSPHHHIPHSQHHGAGTSLSPVPQSAPPSIGTFLPSVLSSTTVSAPDNVMTQLFHSEDVFAESQPPSVTADPPSTLAAESRPHGQLVSKIVLDPPDIETWRQKLFNVDETIILTNEQFETYFPHIDNVYSHRSTQRYKRKPFISHYWDCRMKGRPPGTPKSDDPAKKKRKRNARERDLCDVKIKITEYFPGATIQLDDDEQHNFGDGFRNSQPGANGEKFWTVQRVNGNGGNGKGDGVAGPHKHSLDKSDEIKKSTIQRFLATQEKEARKAKKPSHRQPSGQALQTVKKHNKDQDLKLYAACFCPFSQRVWIALEAKGIQYQYCETDPYKRPTNLLEANPRGLVPAIREGDWACGESSIILEYLEDRDCEVPLFPTDARLKANCRLWIDHINIKVVPSFYALARAEDSTAQYQCLERLQADITALVQAADERGPYFLGADMCLVDIHFAPFAIRLSRMFRERRKWLDPMPGTRWHQWADALVSNPHVQATTSNNELYAETFELFTTPHIQPQEL